MAVNRVKYGNQILIDITDSTVNANNLLKGIKAYGANGEQVIGNLEAGSSAEIIITYESKFYNKTITCSNGTKTYTKITTDSGSTNFEGLDEGVWTITCDGVTTSVNIVFSYFTQFAPNGKTITPLYDIQIWLNCANIFDSEYTTLGEVLADKTTLLALMSSENAVNYLVRNKDWTISPTNLIPVMTSDTSPSGRVFYTTADQNIPYKAFTENPTSGNGWWSSRDNTGLAYIGYEFQEPEVVKKIHFWYGSYSGTPSNFAIYFQGSNDFETWTDLSDAIYFHVQTFKGSNPTTEVNLEIDNDTAYKYYRLSNKNLVNWNYSYAILFDIRMYKYNHFIGIVEDKTAMSIIGANNYCANTLLADDDWCEAICNSEYFESVLNVKVPTMTSTTTPEGQVVSQNPSSVYTDWHAFSGIDAHVDGNYAGVDPETGKDWIGYIFTTPVMCKYITWKANTVDSDYMKSADVIVQGTDDGTNWVDIKTVKFSDLTLSSILSIFMPDNIKSYKGYRIMVMNIVTARNLHMTWFRLLQFYSRKDV